MKLLWAPWRKAYIRPEKPQKKSCLFCRLLNEKKDTSNYILKRSSSSFSLLNLYPYNGGHVMVVPNRHVNSLSKLKNPEKLDLLHLVDEMIEALEKSFKPHGFNLGINMGRAAGAGVPKHIHIHIVPRWKGDNNFMSVTADTKVVSESLDSAYKAISKTLKKRR